MIILKPIPKRSFWSRLFGSRYPMADAPARFWNVYSYEVGDVCIDGWRDYRTWEALRMCEDISQTAIGQFIFPPTLGAPIEPITVNNQADFERIFGK